MKNALFTSIVVAFAVLFIAALPQEKEHKGMDHQKHMQMMEMMKDSTMMDMMMGHITTDKHLRMQMMHKMIQHAKSDSTYRMEMSTMMMDDKDMHSCMMQMMGGMMHYKSSIDMMDHDMNSEHNDHH